MATFKCGCGGFVTDVVRFVSAFGNFAPLEMLGFSREIAMPAIDFTNRVAIITGTGNGSAVNASVV
jgi:hypothetical protein